MVAVVLVAAVLVVGRWAVEGGADLPSHAAPSSRSAVAGPPGPLVDAARSVLGSLPIREAGPSSGYSRAAFGQAWSDDVAVEGGRDGCDTRNDVLRRDLREVVVTPGTRGCVVLSGVLTDPYTGAELRFERGAGSSSRIQIDHVVALAAAWRTGARELSVDRRRDLANDPLGLLAVSAVVNSAKSDSDASGWMPPVEVARCGYVARQVLVKQRYGLWLTPPEWSAITIEFARCP